MSGALQEGQLLKLDRLDFQQKFSVVPVDLFGGQFSAAGVLHVDGVKVFRDEMPIQQMNNAAGRVLGMDADLDQHHAGQLLEKVKHRDVDVVDSALGLEEILGGGLNGLFLLFINSLIKPEKTQPGERSQAGFLLMNCRMASTMRFTTLSV